MADTTLGYDQEVKLPLYAVAGIPEVWIVVVEAWAVEVYRKPSQGRFQGTDRVVPGDVLRPDRLPGVHVEVEGILGTE